MPESNRPSRFAQRLADAAKATGAMLDSLLAAATLPGETMRPPRLLEAMRWGTLNGGKRLRPFLVAETAALFGIEGVAVWRTAAALEMVHSYSLVHDDLPAMDDDDLRRGRPAVHRAFDEATAILAGDGLLTLAFDTLADPATHPSGDMRAALVLALARSAGLGGMAGGQALDLAAEQSPQPLDRAGITRLQAMKTGALIACAVEAGALLGAAPPPVAKSLAIYARALGAAFQLADDILDIEGDSTKLGKAANKDAGRNKATLVQLLGLAAAKQHRDALVAQANAALEQTGLGAKTDVLRQTANFVAFRES